MSRRRPTEDEQAHHDHRVREWYNRAPSRRNPYEGPPMSEDEQAIHDDAVKRWYNERPESLDDGDWAPR